MSSVGATAMLNVLLPTCEEMESIAIPWHHSAGANEVWNEKSQPTQCMEKKQIALCSHCCVRLFTVIGNSAPARQAPQISPTLTPAREIVFHSVLHGLCWFPSNSPHPSRRKPVKLVRSWLLSWQERMIWGWDTCYLEMWVILQMDHKVILKLGFAWNYQVSFNIGENIVANIFVCSVV